MYVFTTGVLRFCAGPFFDKYINEKKISNMTITINGKTAEIRFNFKAEILYEEIVKESFTGTSTTSWITMMFCSIVACAGDDFVKYGDFVDYLSENPDVFYEYVAWYSETVANISSLAAISREESKTTGKKGGKSARKGS